MFISKIIATVDRDYMNYWYILLQKVPFQWLAHPLSHMPVNLLQDAPFLQWPGQSTHDLFDMKFPLGHTVIYTHLFTKQVSNKVLTVLIDLHKFIHLVKHTPPPPFYPKHFDISKIREKSN